MYSMYLYPLVLWSGVSSFKSMVRMLLKTMALWRVPCESEVIFLSVSTAPLSPPLDVVSEYEQLDCILTYDVCFNPAVLKHFSWFPWHYLCLEAGKNVFPLHVTFLTPSLDPPSVEGSV